MPDTHSLWRTDRPVEGFHTAPLAADPGLVVRTFVPDQYEPRYSYPLLVMFHGAGGNEESVLRLAPKASRRNFLALSLRGPDARGTRSDGMPGFGWGTANGVDLSEYVIRAVEQTRRTYHVHSERIYLVGIGEGATAAYKAAFRLGNRIAGLVALNGMIPRPLDGNPVFAFEAPRDLRILIAHGKDNSTIPLGRAARDARLLDTCGATVRFTRYNTAHRIHPDMLRDLNRWVIDRVNAEHDQFACNRMY